MKIRQHYVIVLYTRTPQGLRVRIFGDAKGEPFKKRSRAVTFLSGIPIAEGVQATIVPVERPLINGAKTDGS